MSARKTMQRRRSIDPVSVNTEALKAIKPRKAVVIEDKSSRRILYGSMVLLEDELGYGYLGGEGFLDSSVNVLSKEDALNYKRYYRHDISERLFIVMPEQQHAATSALKKLRDQGASGESLELEEIRLIESEKLEAELNRETTSRLLGQPVQYGRQIQLKHVLSGTMIEMNPTLLAEYEKDSMLVKLDGQNIPERHLQLTSKYKHVTTGDCVCDGDDIILYSAKWNLYLHVSEVEHFEGTTDKELRLQREVNAAHVPTAWTISLYCQKPPLNNSMLSGGSVIRFLLLDSGRHLTTHKQVLDATGTNLDYVVTSEALSKKADHSMTSSISTLWEIQHLNILHGEPIAWEDAVFIFNIATGQYLSVKKAANTLQLCLVSDPNVDCHFSLRKPISSISLAPDIYDKQSVYIQHCTSKEWLDISGSGPAEIISCVNYPNRSDAIRVEVVSRSFVVQAQTLLCLVPALKALVEPLFQLKKIKLIKAKTCISSARNIMRVIENFLLESNEQHIESSRACRNAIISELDIIKHLVEILKSPFSQWGGIYDLVRLREDTTSYIEKEMEMDGLIMQVLDMCRSAYALLQEMVHGDESCQDQCEKYVEIFLQQLGCTLHAEDLVEIVLAYDIDRVTMLPDQIAYSCLEYVSATTNKVPFLQCLSNLCCCQETGIRPKQNDLCDRLFIQYDEVVDVNTKYLLRCQTEVDGVAGIHVQIQYQGELKWVALDILPVQHFQEYLWFATTIELFASMCCSRNYRCIHMVETLLPRLSVLKALQNQKLPPTIRAAFVRLIINAYVDRLPYEPQAIPTTIMGLSDTAEKPEDRWTKSSMGSLKTSNLAYFMTLKKVVIETLKQCNGSFDEFDPEGNFYTLSILNLGLCLLKFGFYCSKEEVLELLKLLMVLVDDRSVNEPVPLVEASTLSGIIEAKKSSDKVSSRIMTVAKIPNAISFSLSRNNDEEKEAASPGENPKSKLCVENPTSLQAIDSSAKSENQDSEKVTYIQAIKDKFIKQESFGRASKGVRKAPKVSPDEDNKKPGRDMQSRTTSAVLRPLSTTSRYERTPSNLVIMVCKERICQILKVLLLRSIDHQLSVVFQQFHNRLHEVFPLDEKGQFTEVVKDMIGNSLTVIARRPNAKAQQAAVESSNVATHIAAVFAELQSTPLDYDVIKMDPMYKKNAKKTDRLRMKILEHWESHLQIETNVEKATERTLLHPSVIGKDVVAVLTDLLMYKHPGLVSAAIDVLGAYFNVKNEFLQALRRVEVLATKKSCQLYIQLRANHLKMKLFEETGSTWIGNEDDTLRELINVLKWFEFVSGFDEHGFTRIDAGGHPFKTYVQRFLSQCDAHNTVFNLLQTLVSAFKTKLTESVSLKRKDDIGIAIEHCSILIRAFVHRNAGHQALLITRVPKLIDFVMEYAVHVLVLRDICRDNVDVCVPLGPMLAEMIVKMLAKSGYVVAFLELAMELVVCNGMPIEQNQNILSLLLMRHKAGELMLLYSNGEQYEERAQLMAQLSTPNDNKNLSPVKKRKHRRLSCEGISIAATPVIRQAVFEELKPVMESIQQNKIIYPTEPLEYHMVLLELLSKMTLGSNYVCKARLQGLLPLEDIVMGLKDERTILPVRMKLMMVLRAGWLDSLKPDPIVRDSIELTQLFGSIGQNLLKVFSTAKIAPTKLTAVLVQSVFTQELDYVWNNFLPAVRSYYSIHFDPASATKYHKDALSLVATGLRSLCDTFSTTRAIKACTRDQVLMLSDAAFAVLTMAEASGILFTALERVVALKEEYSESEPVDVGIPIVRKAVSKLSKMMNDSDSPALNLATSLEKYVGYFCSYVDEVLSKAHRGDQKTLLDAFMDMGKPDASVRSKGEGPHRTNSIPRSRAISVVNTGGSMVVRETLSQFDALTGRLVNYLVDSDMFFGKKAQEATIVVIQILHRVALTSNAMRNRMMRFGVIEITTDLICRGAEDDLNALHEVIKLAIGLLSGGQVAIQNEFVRLFRSGLYTRFFSRINEYLINGIKSISFRLQDFESNDGLLHMFEFIILLCRGHHSECQRLLREQESETSTNVVSCIVTYFGTLKGALNEKTFHIAAQVVRAIESLTQGPCLENQQVIIDPQQCNGHDFVEIVIYIFALDHREYKSRRVRRSLADLKRQCSVALNALIEGRSDTILHQRIASLLPIILLRRKMVDVYANFLLTQGGKYRDEAFIRSGFSAAALQRGSFAKWIMNIVTGVTSQNTNARECVDETPTQDITLDFGFNIYFLFKAIMDVPSLKAAHQEKILPSILDDGVLFKLFPSRLSRFHQLDENVQYSFAYRFFEGHSASVEFLRDGSLHRLRFPRPPVCEYLTEDMRNRVMINVGRDNPSQKIQDLFRFSDELITEMTHRYLMQFQGSYYFKKCRDISFLITLLVNALMVECYMTEKHATELSFNHPDIGKDLTIDGVCVGQFLGIEKYSLIAALDILQLVASTTILLTYFISFGPLRILKQWKQREMDAQSRVGLSTVQGTEAANQNDFKPSVNQEATISSGGKFVKILLSIGFLLQDKTFVHYVIYFCMTLLTLTVHPFFNAFHLIDVILRYQELTMVLLAVAVPYKALLLTFMLAMIAIYYFSLFGFSFFHEHYRIKRAANAIGQEWNQTVEECYSLVSCFLTTLDNGFKRGGGVGEYLVDVSPTETYTWIGRVFFDTLFFILIITVLMNIMFGIIIDTFADQRSKLQARQEDMVSRCYICNLERSVFDRIRNNGYMHHIRYEHSLWDYVFLAAYLRLKNPAEHNGDEKYLWNLLQRHEYSFVPLYKSIVVEQSGGEGHSGASVSSKVVDDEQSTH